MTVPVREGHAHPWRTALEATVEKQGQRLEYYQRELMHCRLSLATMLALMQTMLAGGVIVKEQMEAACKEAVEVLGNPSK